MTDNSVLPLSCPVALYPAAQDALADSRYTAIVFSSYPHLSKFSRFIDMISGCVYNTCIAGDLRHPNSGVRRYT